jgi:hypothetical protein
VPNVRRNSARWPNAAILSRMSRSPSESTVVGVPPSTDSAMVSGRCARSADWIRGRSRQASRGVLG